MSEETKEYLSKTEYEEIGEMLLELIAGCPYTPKDTPIKYQSKDVGRCIYLFTTGGEVKKRNVLGGFTAELNIQVAYRNFPQSNEQMLDAQLTVDKITGWMEELENLPGLTDNRIITKITASESFPVVEEVDGEKTTVFTANVVMEYEVE